MPLLRKTLKIFGAHSVFCCRNKLLEFSNPVHRCWLVSRSVYALNLCNRNFDSNAKPCTLFRLDSKPWIYLRVLFYLLLCFGECGCGFFRISFSILSAAIRLCMAFTSACGIVSPSSVLEIVPERFFHQWIVCSTKPYSPASSFTLLLFSWSL